MKKLLSVGLTLFMVFVLSISVFAISVDEAKEIAYKNAGFESAEGLTFKEVEEDEDDKSFDIEFSAVVDEMLVEYDYEIRAKDGAVLEMEVDFPERVSPAEQKLTPEDAKNLAFKFYGKSDVKALEIDYDEKDNEYEVEFIDEGKEVEFEISAYDGYIESFGYEVIGDGNAAIANVVTIIREIIAFLKSLFKIA